MIGVAHKRGWHWLRGVAVWAGFIVPGMETHFPGVTVDRSRLALFYFMNWPWSSIGVTAAVILWGGHFPMLTRTYVLAGVAGTAAVARVAPALAEAANQGGTGVKRSVSQAAHASRRAMGWSLAAFLTLPWIGSHANRLDWLALVIPASFAGRALWEPWWWQISWMVAGWLGRIGF